MSSQFFSLNSYGTFGFWSAYLKGSGDVIMASETSKVPTFVEENVRQILKHWNFIPDPCYQKDHLGNVTLLNDCVGLV
jgi:hypothetical protein